MKKSRVSGSGRASFPAQMAEAFFGLPTGHAVRQLDGYTDMLVCGHVARRLTTTEHSGLWRLGTSSGLFLPHLMPAGIGFLFHGLVDVFCHRRLGDLVPWFISHPMRQDIGFRDHGGS